MSLGGTLIDIFQWYHLFRAANKLSVEFVAFKDSEKNNGLDIKKIFHMDFKKTCFQFVMNSNRV